MDTPPKLATYVAQITLLASSLVTIGRLSALASIGESEFVEKHEAAERTWRYLCAADELFKTLNDHCDNRRAVVVSWPDYAEVGRPEGQSDPVDPGTAAERLAMLLPAASSLGTELLAELEHTAMLRIGRLAVRRALDLLEQNSSGSIGRPSSAAGSGWELLLKDSGQPPPSSALRRLRGPGKSPLPRAFERSSSLDTALPPPFGERISEAVPYMWSVSTREMMAADLCSLTLAEYDGLPLPFYLDLAKQAVDEAGHAIYFFRTAQELFDELEQDRLADRELLDTVRAFRATGTGLPVPREGNLYEAIWSATLSERLVIMHHDTEGPAVKKLGERIKGEFCRTHPSFQRAVEIDRYDEMSHAAIGARWLRHLFPEVQARKKAIAEARRVRGMLLLGSFACHGPDSLKELVFRYRDRAIAAA